MATKQSSKAKRRAPKPPVYKASAPDIALGREHFRVVLRRAKRKLPTLELDELVEHIDWQRDGAVRSGELTFRRPLAKRSVGIVSNGDTVDLYYAPINSTRWRLVWRMKVDTPNHQIRDGILSVAIKAQLEAAGKSHSGWKMRAGRRAHQVAKIAAARYRIRVGRLAAGKAKLPKLLKKRASVLDVVNWAYQHERQDTGRRFDVNVSRGVLDVDEVRDSPFMLMLGPAIIDATVTTNPAAIASAVVVTSSRKVKGSNKRVKIRVRVVDKARVKRYGYIVRHVDKADLSSRAAARKYGRNVLARTYRRRDDIEFTHPGIPWLEKGQACTLDLPEEGLKQVCWTKAVRHSLAAGSYEMTVTVGFADPYKDARAERVKKKRAAAARAHRRKTTTAATTLKTKKTARRAAT